MRLSPSADSSRSVISLRDLWPDCATYQPGDPVAIHVALINERDVPHAVLLDGRLSWLDTLVTEWQQPIDVPPGETISTLPVPVPSLSGRGYGFDLALRAADDGRTLGQGSTAFDVLTSWTEAPRYGFLADFAPQTQHPANAVEALSRYHINVVQFYDWMWRHYTLMPPAEEFTDALGRQLSLRTVRAKVRACHARSMAALGYAAVYGAEEDYALAHPDEMLYDANGEPYSLEKLFYNMNIHRGNPWRERILGEMARAVEEVPFDGLHLDQYGFPQDNVFGADRTSYDLADDFPPFIDDARMAIREVRPGSRVIFNAVGNWPIATVAPTQQDATYIEVWPPDESYADLQRLIHTARELAPSKQVILAAYLAPLQGAQDTDLPAAEAATVLASAAIWANGGFHLLLGETDGALCDPYYPRYAVLRPGFARIMRRYYDLVVRYENVLSDARLLPTDGATTVRVEGVPVSFVGEAGRVWAITRAMPGLQTLSLINLTQTTDARWNVPQPPPQAIDDIEVAVRVAEPVLSVFATSPDEDEIAAHDLPYTVEAEGDDIWVRVRLPRLLYWSLIVIKTAAWALDNRIYTSACT